MKIKHYQFTFGNEEDYIIAQNLSEAVGIFQRLYKVQGIVRRFYMRECGLNFDKNSFWETHNKKEIEIN